MKISRKLLTIVFSLLLLGINTYSQTPQAIKYQAVARDATGNPVSNQMVNLRISILQGSASGAVAYSEIHTCLTNNFGLANLNIGTGTVINGTFSTINWGANTYFIKVEMDITGGLAYVDMGTSQLLSVPFALYAENVHNAPGHPHTLTVAGNTLSMTNGNTVSLPAGLPSGVSGNTLLHNGSSWISNSLIYNNGTSIGINNISPQALFHLSNGSALWDGVIGSTPASGSGTRMMWIPSKSAFRAGQISGNQWDNDSIGNYSAAFGLNNKVEGSYSFAAGLGCTATAYASAVFGRYNVTFGTPGTWYDSEPVFVIGNGSSASLTSNALTVMKDGKLGISTSFPVSKLDVRNELLDKSVNLTNNYTGAASKIGLYSALSAHGSGSKYGIYSNLIANPSGTTPNYGVYSALNSNNTSGNIYGLYTSISNTGTGGHYGVYSYTPGGWAGYFSSGNVYVADKMAIGTTTIPAGYAFALNGKMICEELKVQLNASWPDYVFNPEFKLLSLSRLESEIGILGHLPGMPSAQEVKDEGIGVGEISRQLTQKVEELTLYLIQLNKKVEALQKENRELKAMINH